jgi:ArsR family transcriptional regulator
MLLTKSSSIDRLFRAFSDRTRLRILSLLREGEVCVCDLVSIVGAPQPTISRHLAYLRKAKLVVARKEGQWMHYSLAPAKGAVHQKLLECLEHCGGEMPELEKDGRKLKQDREGECCG